MQLTKTKHKEILEVYSTWMDAYLNADVSTYDSYFDDDYHFIGSTNNEEFLNRKDTTEFFRVTGEQFAGLMDLRNESKTLEQFGNHVLLTHMCDTWFKNDEDWSYYGRFRLSSVLHNTKAGWKFIYQHFSMPDAKSEEGQSIGFDKVHIENQELREAIQRRTKELELKNRELEVESALERIRSQAVAMKASTDLLDIVVTMRNEFIKLGHEAHYFWHMMWLPKTYEKAMTSGDGSKIGFVMTLPKHMHGDIALLSKWEKSKKPTVVYTMNAEQAIDYVDKMVTLGDFKNIDPQAPTHDDIKHIGGLTFIMARTTHGEIGYSLPGVVQNPPKEDLDQLIRFAGTFDLAHQRFLDLQKAEAQAKETKVELSLERIRSRVAEMKASSDLFDIVVTMRNEFLSLGHEADYFWHMRWLEDSYEMSMTAEDGGRLGMVISVPKFVHEHIASLHHWEKSNNPYFILALNGKEAWDYIDNMNTHGKYQQIDPHAPTEEDILQIGGLTFIIARTTHGEIGFSLAGKVPNPPKESIETLLRFAKVFDLAYKRFEDLQKAEKQARETQIELGLEKVRSRSMAMHHTSELLDTAAELFHQLEDLGIKPWRCGMAILNTDDTKFEFWSETTTPKGRSVSVNGTTSITGKTHKHVKGAVKAIKEKKDFYNYDLSGKNLIDYINYITKDFNLPEASQNVTELPERLVYYCATFSRGVIYGAFLATIQDAEQQTLKRFAKVFDQTYTRFLDLQKAEEQAREAQIEAALEKVRSRSLAVHKSEEFKDVISIVFEKLKELQIPATAAGIGIKINGSKDLDSFVCGENEEGLVITNYRLPYFKNKISKDICNAFENEANVFIGQYTKAVKNNFYKYVLDKTSEFKDLPEDILGMIFNSSSYTITMVSSEYVVFNINDFEGKSLTEHEIDIVKRFSRVFNQAYIRFLDLQKSEAQAREAQIEAALERLRSRTMAMQKSDELLEAGALLYKELNKLGIDNLTTGYVLLDEDAKIGYSYGVNPADGSIRQPPVEMPHDETSIMKSIVKSWKNEDSLLVIELNEEETIKHQTFIAKRSKNFPISAKQLLALSPDKLKIHTFNFKQGYLLLIGSNILTKPDQRLVVRFAKVFEQTYTRFLDLQKAEAQARESEIELALERVRARTMAMQHSNELAETATLLFKQINDLGIETWTSGFNIWEKNDTSFIGYNPTPSGGITAPYHIPSTKDPFFKKIYKAKKSGESFLVFEATGKSLAKTYRYMKTLPVVKEVLQGIEDSGTQLPKSQINHCPFFSHGFLLFITLEPYPEEHDIFKRFAKVFDQTYTRFLDLQKAEAQAREAQIEASLERVRSKTMAMHSSQDVGNTMVLLFEELENLGIKANRNGIIILDEEEHGEIWTAKLNMNSEIELLAWNLDMNLHALTKQVYKAWKNKNSGTVYPLIEDDLKAYYKALNKSTDIPVKFKSEMFPQREWCYTFNFNEGFIYLFTDKEMTQEHQQIPERFASVFGQTYRRYQDLKKAEAQAREAEINLGVERVRAKALAMHKSEEIIEVVAKLKDEVMGLNIPGVVAATIFLEAENDSVRMWDLSSLERTDQGYLAITDITFKLKKKDPHLYVKRVWENPEDYFIEIQNSKDLDRIIEFMYENNQREIAKEVEDYTKSTNLTKLYHASKSLSNGKLCIDLLEEPPEEMQTILNKMGAAFDLAYKRFEDIKKAETQAKEAQIEAALERVRSASMAMHKSEEIGGVAFVLFEQLKSLGGELWGTGFGFCKIDSDVDEFWFANENGIMPHLKIPNNIDDAHKKLYQNWNKAKELFSIAKGGKALEEHYNYMLSVPDVQPIFQRILDNGISFPTWQKWHAAYFKYGYLLAITTKPYKNEDIFIRFAKVFEQAYIRFLDLQKAEEQARDAQIETALERIRSRSMAMHNSKELSEVILVLFKQFKLLGLTIDTCFIDIFDTVNAGFNAYIGTGTAIYPNQAFLPYMDHPIHQLNKDARQGKIDFFTFDEDKDSKDRYFKHFYANAKGIEVPQERRELIANGVGITGAAALGKHSAVHIFNYRGIKYTNEENDILRRVNTVFQQTYTRFLDLQKAEAREREAIIQASLDRVRAEIASMRHATDLQRITPLVWSELKALGVPFFRCGVMIVNEDTNILDFYLSNPEGQALAALHLNFDNNDITKNGIDYWRKNEIYIEHWDQEQFIGFMKELLSQGQIVDAAKYQGGDHAPTSLTLQFVPFTQGMVYVGSEKALSKEELELVEALGKSLSVAYARYEDFTKLDVAKAKAEKALLDLKAVQEQLIQQEKLASLGQLTAGIAHEIKNPLNFVNNFSDLSRELIEEVFVELEHIADSEAKVEIITILSDVRSNLNKVNEHGTRADSIVTSMLQHSRASGSKREPKPFNPLVKEFVNLSFHGMRAGKSPINVKIDLQLDPKVGDVTLISEDFSRVILNLSNNAFDAMRDKLNHNNKPAQYMPELTVKTELDSNMVILSIGDNGPGISKDIQDKILQPFFTTKKGTEGTGLGLSITNDIIKAHRGELSLKSTERKGTIFSIKIPIQ